MINISFWLFFFCTDYLRVSFFSSLLFLNGAVVDLFQILWEFFDCYKSFQCYQYFHRVLHFWSFHLWLRRIYQWQGPYILYSHFQHKTWQFLWFVFSCSHFFCFKILLCVVNLCLCNMPFASFNTIWTFISVLNYSKD